MATSNRARIICSARSGVIGITVALFLAVIACTSMKVKMGMKVYLDRTPVSAMQVTMPNGASLAPGEKEPLEVTFTEPGGKTLTTEGSAGGPVMWKELNVSAALVSFDGKGKLSLASDPRISDGKIGHVTVTVPSHPELRGDLDITVQYKRNYVADFSGRSGSDGTNGSDGTSGTSGSMGSMDPNNPSAGGDGGNGSDGSNGWDGDNGSDGAPVQVRVALRAGNNPLLQVMVAGEGRQNFYLVDPHGGSLMVRSDGGRGGSGGRGGRGGRGGSGGMGSPSGSNGRDGSDGRNGSDGSPGRGGQITVTYDPHAGPYLGVIHLSSVRGPVTVFRQQAVAALW